jgi:uncharacterized membrane protein YgcG
MARTLFALTCSLAAALALSAAPALADDFGPHRPGQHVYDRAQALSADRLAGIERQAAGLEASGVPTIVYVRSSEAGEATTRQDARSLMDAWGVESAPGARDGLVLFANLKPSDPGHGSAVLVAGAAEAAAGRLTDARLQAIFDGEMRPRLAAGDVAGAISAALAQVAADLRAPAAGGARTATLGAPAAGLLDLLAAALALAVGGWLLLVWRRSRPRSGPSTLRPPDWSTPAAAAGALAAGRSLGDWLLATVLDLARKGALRIEAVGPHPVIAVRVLDPGRATARVERRVLDPLVAQADPSGAVFLAGAHGPRWPLRRWLASDLADAGLLAARPRARRVGVVAVAALAAAALLGVVAMVTRQPLLLAGLLALLAAGAAGFVLVPVLPETSERGEAAAAGWRGLRAGLRAAAPGTIPPDDLARLLPFAVALNGPHSVGGHVAAAAASGRWPGWLVPVDAPAPDLLAAWQRLVWELTGRPAARPAHPRTDGASAGWEAGPAATSVDVSSSSSFGGGPSSGSSSGAGSF